MTFPIDMQTEWSRIPTVRDVHDLQPVSLVVLAELDSDIRERLMKFRLACSHFDGDNESVIRAAVTVILSVAACLADVKRTPNQRDISISSFCSAAFDAAEWVAYER